MDNPGLARKDGIEAGDGGSIAAYKRRLLGPAALQKLLAFASLVLLLIYFSFASPAFMQTDNMINILQATAVNGVLAIASTFVIITAGIDLSVGTLMTFCAVMAGVFLTYWELPMWTGILAAIATGALSGGVSGTLIAKMKVPPFIATLGMMLVARGVALQITDAKAIGGLGRLVRVINGGAAFHRPSRFSSSARMKSPKRLSSTATAIASTIISNTG